MADTRSDTVGTAEEVRLALVLNGGVSLAVWMGGVTHELDLLRRASRGDPVESVDLKDRSSFLLWQRLTAEKGKRVLIDVIAGTSAGGLNGMLLAVSIGRGAGQADLRKTWREAAELDRLLATDASGSLMRGEVIEETLAKVVRDMGQDSGQAEPVTLFLTATALDGRPQTYADGYGGEFDVRDHRRIYRFQHDPQWLTYRRGPDRAWRIEKRPRTDFAGDIGDRNSALVQAARATAGFPVAFAPVHEFPMREYREQPKGIPTSCVMDGGVLTNEPFRPVLDAIGSRRMDGQVERILVYVAPSSGLVPQEKIGQTACHDILWTEAATNAMAYPRESNLRSSAEDLSNRLRTSVGDVQDRLFERLSGQGAGELADQLLYHASALIDEYRRGRAAAVIWDARQMMASSQRATSLVSLPQANPERVLDQCVSWLPPARAEPVDAVATPFHDHWRWGISPAERVIRLLMVALHDRVRACPQRQDRFRSTVGEISEQLRITLAVMDAVRADLCELAHAQDSDVGVADEVCRVFEEMKLPETLGAAVRTAARAYHEALRLLGDTRWDTPEELVSCCLAVEVLTDAFAPVSRVVEPLTPRFRFLRLGPDDLGPLFWKDQYADIGARKLYGLRLNHFGAFVNEAWRASDFTWGRLDAAHHLLRVLIEHSSSERRRWEKELHTAILAGEIDGEQMEANLDQLKGEDSVLLDDFIRTEEGTHALRKTTDSALRLVLSEPPVTERQGSTQRVLHRVRPALRAALDADHRPAGLAQKVLRFLLRRTRAQLHTRPMPTDLRQALRRDLAGVRRVGIGLAVLCAVLGAGVALAIALPLVR
ncbi:DUF3376 domain-containing protein [Kitasatospora sp. NPDC048545]|uniref:DUF3376 domain-containing protein n=1 Tax=Kitasatospora sp. NPDC048545 TaxID=3157208 RepID=UPI003405F7D9